MKIDSQELIEIWLDDPEENEQTLLNYISTDIYDFMHDLVPKALWEDGNGSEYSDVCDELAESMLNLLKIVKNTTMDRVVKGD